MSEREAFIEAIAADPADDIRRLAFADWLQEHGEEDRAEFVRVIHELTARQAGLKEPFSLPGDLRKLQARILKLFESHGAVWLEQFCHALGVPDARATRRESWPSQLLRHLSGKPRRTIYTLKNVHFGSGSGSIEEWNDGPLRSLNVWRGFVNCAQIHLGSRPSVRDIGAAFRLEPVNGLWLKVADNLDQWRRVNAPCLARVADLTLEVPAEYEPQIVSALETILRDGHWSGLRDLHLWRNFVGFRPAPREYVERLADSPILAGLRSLSLLYEQPDLFPLTANSRLTSLSKFAAWGCRLTADAADILTGAAFRPNLEELHLSNNSFGDIGAGQLAAVAWPKLQALDLGFNEIGDAGVRDLMPLIPQLARLSLAGGAITDAGAIELAESVDLERLRSLCLSYNPISPETVAALRARFGDRFQFRSRAEDGLGP